MALEEFLDEWHRQANEYGASLTRDQRDIAEQAWLIATQQEREACARVCDRIAADRWALYKGRPPYNGSEDGRACQQTQGESIGAEDCATAIRARGES